MEVRSYQDLEVWKKAMKLTAVCYTATKSFPKDELYGLTSQLRRAAVSVPANIAEGHARRSRPDFQRFLSIALGSLAELETHILLSVELEYLDNQSAQPILHQADEVGRMLRGLDNALKAKASTSP